MVTQVGGNGDWFAKISDIDFAQTDDDEFVDDVAIWAEGGPVAL